MDTLGPTFHEYAIQDEEITTDNLPIFHLERISTGDNISELRV
jgi:hypothetical protein